MMVAGILSLIMVSAYDDLEVGTSTICLEDQLRSLGFIRGNDGSLYGSVCDPAFFKDINLEANLSNKKVLFFLGTINLFCCVSQDFHCLHF